MHGNIPYMFNYWADPDVCLFRVSLGNLKSKIIMPNLSYPGISFFKKIRCLECDALWIRSTTEELMTEY